MGYFDLFLIHMYSAYYVAGTVLRASQESSINQITFISFLSTFGSFISQHKRLHFGSAKEVCRVVIGWMSKAK